MRRNEGIWNEIQPLPALRSIRMHQQQRDPSVRRRLHSLSSSVHPSQFIAPRRSIASTPLSSILRNFHFLIIKANFGRTMGHRRKEPPLGSFLMLLTTAFCSTNAQQSAADLAVLSSPDNMKKLAEIYGFATQIMNLGGSFLGGGEANGGGGGINRNGGRSNGLNSVLGEVIKPSFGGYSDYRGASNNPMGSGGSQSFMPTYGEYGGGPLGAGSSRPQSRSIIESLMGTFLGSSMDSEQPPSSPVYAPNFAGYGGSSQHQQQQKAGAGSNIDAIVRTLMRNGAKKAEASESDGPTSFLSQFFGRK
uniref:Uncharacterized protein n=1 Tax=Globodera rostochiensis TaxID=31243 RepID=A0A914HI82_GLORO